jgi:pimeloyl-ACP methyl ester carboxylesterase
MMLAILAAASLAAGSPVTIPGPRGALAGTLIDPSRRAPALVIIPGSGPTDRDGDNVIGVKGAIYRQLAEQLGANNVATLRIDKRGMFGSKGAVLDGNAVTIADYAADVRGWVGLLRRRGKRCAWLAGHSEGGLVALAAAQDPRDICGLVLLSTPGRPIGQALRDQLRTLPPAQFAPAEAAIVRLERGQRVDPQSLPVALRTVFAPQVQPYFIDLLSHDPAKLAARVRLPILIVTGDSDLQTGLVEARALAAANRRARLVIIPGMNHVWKRASASDRRANIATYGNAALAIDRSLAPTIARFVRKRR